MRRPVTGTFSQPWLGIVAPAFLILTVCATLIGCEVERVKFSRIEEGKKFLAAADPFQAAVYFEEALTKEPDKKPEAEALLVVACDRAMAKVADIPSERQKYERLKALHLQSVRSDPAAMAQLVAILDYHDVNSQSAEHILIELGEESAGPLLSAYSEREDERATILRVLGEIGVSAVPAVEVAIHSDNLVAAEQAALVRLIGSMNSARAESFLRQVRNESTAPGVQAEAAAALYRLGVTSERDFLIAALDSDRVLDRRAAASAMAYIDDMPKAEVLLARLDDEDAEVRLALAAALARYPGTPQAVAALIRVVRADNNGDVSRAAVETLASYGPMVIDPLLEAFALETRWPLRQRMIRALSSDTVRQGFTQDQEYRLYQLYEKRAKHPQVRGDMAQLLESLEKK